MDLTPVTYEQVLMLFAETERRMQQTDKQMAETDKRIVETDKQIAETGKQIAETDKQLKRLAKQIADVTDSMGRFAEEQVRPRVLQLFQAKGIDLKETFSRVNIKKDEKFLLEIDLLLINTIYSVVVEVKNTLRQRDIDEHLDRMSKLQEASSKTIRGTTMFGAVAGMIITDEVEYYAIKKGLYVLKPKGDNIEIANEDDFEPKTWEAMK